MSTYTALSNYNPDIIFETSWDMFGQSSQQTVYWKEANVYAYLHRGLPHKPRCGICMDSYDEQHSDTNIPTYFAIISTEDCPAETPFFVQLGNNTYPQNFTAKRAILELIGTLDICTSCGVVVDADERKEDDTFCDC
jgi:hypothetical protein